VTARRPDDARRSGSPWTRRIVALVALFAIVPGLVAALVAGVLGGLIVLVAAAVLGTGAVLVIAALWPRDENSG
jgi:uncharacterized BrkB/YihY/UPF0761 family membrane protein